MPELLSIRRIALEFADLARRSPIERPASPLARWDGPHESDILAWIARNKVGCLKAGERLEEEMPWNMALGVMWEEFYFSLLPDSTWQPGERIVDGVAVNTDGLAIVDLEQYGVVHELPCSVVDETKCTSKRVFTPETLFDQWLYIHQGRVFCYCYGPRVVRWSVMHYRGGEKEYWPVAMEYVVRFSDAEIAQTWAMVTRWKAAAWRALGHTTVPIFEDGEWTLLDIGDDIPY